MTAQQMKLKSLTLLVVSMFALMILGWALIFVSGFGVFPKWVQWVGMAPLMASLACWVRLGMVIK